ncbi:MAG: hypothetical protein JO235_05525 [Chroococcidiopsidaceae cyanobacterium CP_BM_RX_35]|nr:hypothetical protein [Chroococcidiopsidaceae cyanobacterium CP_BM_RX_35]
MTNSSQTPSQPDELQEQIQEQIRSAVSRSEVEPNFPIICEICKTLCINIRQIGCEKDKLNCVKFCNVAGPLQGTCLGICDAIVDAVCLKEGIKDCSKWCGDKGYC